jgi:hypothetical protein
MLASCIVNLILALLATFRIDVIFMFIANTSVGMTLSAVATLNSIGNKIVAFCDTVGDVVESLPELGDHHGSGWRCNPLCTLRDKILTTLGELK